MSVTGSRSASPTEAVAVSVWFVRGLAGASDTVAVGALFATVSAEEVTVEPASAPSVGRTETEIASPLSPWPAALRSSVGEVAPAIAEPFLRHW